MSYKNQHTALFTFGFYNSGFLFLKKTSIFLILSLLLILLGSSFAKAYDKIFIVANVDNQIITNLDLQKRYDFFVKTSRIQASSKAEKLFILNQLTQKLIEEKLQYLDAKKLNIDTPEEELKATLENIALSQGRSGKEMEAFFKKNNIPYDDYVSQIKAQLLWKIVVNQTIAPKVKITQSEIDEMLELQKINGKKNSLNLAEIIIPFSNKKEEVESKSLALKLIKEINDGGDFKNIARQFSSGASSEFDGEIGWVDESAMDSRIQEVIGKLKTGQISGAIKLSNSYYILKLLDKKVVSNLREEEELQIRNLILNKKLKTAAKSYLSKLKQQSYIKIDQEKLKMI